MTERQPDPRLEQVKAENVNAPTGYLAWLIREKQAQPGVSVSWEAANDLAQRHLRDARRAWTAISRIIGPNNQPVPLNPPSWPANN